MFGRTSTSVRVDYVLNGIKCSVFIAGIFFGGGESHPSLQFLPPMAAKFCALNLFRPGDVSSSTSTAVANNMCNSVPLESISDYTVDVELVDNVITNRLKQARW